MFAHEPYEWTKCGQCWIGKTDFWPRMRSCRLPGPFLGAMRMSKTTISFRKTASWLPASAGLAGLGLVLAGCMTVDTKPQLAAVQAAPVAAEVPSYQIASAPVVLSDGTIIPVPRAKPAYAGKPLGAGTRADAVSRTPLSGPISLVDKAAQYRAFDASIDDLANRKFKSPRDVRAALDALRPHDPELLGEGWVANSAFLAANEPEFVAAIKAAASRDGKQAVISRLNSGTGVWMFAGSQKARSVVVADAAVAYQKLTVLGQRFLTTAVEFQRTRWGSYEPAQSFSVNPQFAANDLGGTGLGGVLAELAGITEAQAAVPVMQRILTIAGHIVLEDFEHTRTSTLTENRDLARCTRFSRLNLNQCLAAAHFPSEEAYCTGKHAVNEIAYCWATHIPAAAK